MTRDTRAECQECGGATVEFRFSGKDTQYKVCSRFAEPGHLTREQISRRISDVRSQYEPTSRRFA